jgi:hypothetical protein
MPWVSLDEGCGLALLHRDELPLESSARTGSTGYRLLERRVVILGPFPAGPASGGAMSLLTPAGPRGKILPVNLKSDAWLSLGRGTC